MTETNYLPGKIDVQGCVFDDFLLTDHLPAEQAPATIERDRLIMAARPGFNRKLLPLKIDQQTGKIYSGGRYLFDRYEQAEEFFNWCKNDFELDGMMFLDRPDFADISARVYRVLGAHDFSSIHHQQLALRTEVWQVSAGTSEDKLAELWPGLRDRAEADKKSALWLLHDDISHRLAMVTVVDRLQPAQKPELDFATLEHLDSSESYGDEWSWAEKRFDRSHWVFTIWFPNHPGIQSESALWPNSPPLPAPEEALSRQSAA